MDGVTGLKALGVRDLNYKLLFIANYVEVANNRFDLMNDQDDAEELVVNTISNFMMGVYRDNPWLLDMLKKHLNEIDN